MNEVDNISTKIINAIEREEIDDSVNVYISKADKFLLEDELDKPAFLTEFFIKTSDMLRTTVNGCIKSRNNPKKKDDLKKYKEGYFNEIIQNANDVVKSSGVENPKIKIECKKYNELEYEVKCSYPDKGFSLKDIYGFCSRGNSNKSTELGQEGMYGIGIKSLFCFATYFCIENNIKIELSSDKSLLDNIEISNLNKLPNETKLTLRFQYDNNINNNHAGFNVEKIAKFIDSLIANDECNTYFYSDEVEKVIFDPRSLIFTEQRNNRDIKNSIKEIEFLSDGNTIKLNIDDIYYRKNKNIKISSVKDDMKYIVFNYPDEANDENSLSLAFAINKDWAELRDRIYATYFVSNSNESLLEVKTGCLVNTKLINSSRSGLERENENNPTVLQEIKNKGKNIISDLILILDDDEEVEDNWKNTASDILCHLLEVYKNYQIEENNEIVPKGIFKENIDKIIKLFGKDTLYIAKDKKNILKIDEDDKINFEEESIKKNAPTNSDEENWKMLYVVFNNKIMCVDTIVFNIEDEEFNSISFGIKKLAEYMFNDESSKSWLSGINIPFFNGAKALIKKRIGGDSFNQIMNFIQMNCEEESERLVKQLVARFGVNNSFNYMGNYANNNIVNWLFDDGKNIENEEEFKEACIEYEKSYKNLKSLIQNKILTEKYYHPYHGKAVDMYYEKKEFKRMYFYKDIKNGLVTQEHIMEFLNILSKNIFNFGRIKSEDYIFVQNTQKNISLWYRELQCWNNPIEFKYFPIDFLDQPITNFDNFKSIRQVIDEHNLNLSIDKQSEYQISYLKECNLENANLLVLRNIFKWLSLYENEVKIKIDNITDIKSQETDLIKFTKKLLSMSDINIHLEKIDAGKNGSKFIGYITNGNEYNYNELYIKKSANSNFINFGYTKSYKPNSEKDLVILYSNSSEQYALSEVLKNMKQKTISKYIKYFINKDNIKQLSSSDYDLYLDRPESKYEYAFESEETQSFLKNTLEYNREDIFSILSGEMSYQKHCPICNSIPTLNIKGENKVSVDKNCRVVIIPAEYEEENIHVETICCKSCFEEYKSSLTSAKIIKGEKHNTLEMKSTINDASRSYNFIKNLKISPDNWKIISEFNNLES